MTLTLLMPKRSQMSCLSFLGNLVITQPLAYLGLCESVKHEYRLTKKGEAVLKMQPTEKMLTFAELVLQHKAFNEAYKKADGDPEKITKEDIVAIMKECHLYNINKESTFFRRSSTILGWLKWLCDLDNY
jgi:predicted transcriptional regulator